MSQLQARAPRKDVDFPVELTFDHPDERCFGASVNMSETGMLVLSDGPQTPGTTITFESAPLSGMGEVVWTRGAGAKGVFLGLRFTSLWRGDADVLPTQTAPVEGDRAAWRKAWAGATEEGVTFRGATDQLLDQHLTLAEIAYALGSPVDTVRRARLDPSSPAYRQPPDYWRDRLAELARGRGPALDELARELDGW